MKKVFLSTILFFSASTTTCYTFGFTAKKNSPSLQEFKIAQFDRFSSGFVDEDNVYVYKLSKNLDQATALRIDEFVKLRKGVVSCVTDITSKTVTISVEPQLGKSTVDGLFEVVRHHILGEH